MDSPLGFFAPVVHDEKDLVLQRLRSGELPRGPAQELFGGRGTGACCSGCNRVITVDQIEFEIHAGETQDPLMMHSHCMRIWFDEWSASRRQP
jgi:hypothetical protein